VGATQNVPKTFLAMGWEAVVHCHTIDGPVAELADAGDLKSPILKGMCGFESRPAQGLLSIPGAPRHFWPASIGRELTVKNKDARDQFVVRLGRNLKGNGGSTTVLQRIVRLRADLTLKAANDTDAIHFDSVVLDRRLRIGTGACVLPPLTGTVLGQPAGGASAISVLK
jgi:hypothetical protein